MDRTSPSLFYRQHLHFDTKAMQQTKNDLRSSVMPCRNHAGVILVFKRSRAKVDKPDIG